jgi:hypothetical protein
MVAIGKSRSQDHCTKQDGRSVGPDSIPMSSVAATRALPLLKDVI